MKPEILIVNKAQFGYHTDSYYIALLLADAYEVTYICWDYGLPKISCDKVNTIYISRKGNKVKRYLRLLSGSFKEARKRYYRTIFIVYFRLSSLLPILLGSKRMIVDLRTGATNVKPAIRLLQNMFYRLESIFFRRLTVISEALSKKLKLPSRKVHVLPLGSDIISHTDKDFKELNLIYVGVLTRRDIDHTIKGFAKFYAEFHSMISMSYTIIGFGDEATESMIRSAITDARTGDRIRFVGRVPRQELKKYFDNHNIGVSYVPMNDFLDCQPPTKTFEYLLSGMPTLATATSENRKIINDKNGVLIDHSAEAFYKGLVTLYHHRQSYNSEKIRSSMTDHTWESIINKNLKPYLQKN